MYHLWVDNILFGSVDMNTQKFLIPDGIEYYTGDEALLFQNLKTSVLKIFIKKIYTIDDKIVYLEVLSKNNAEVFMIYIPSKYEINRLIGSVDRKGYTLVPLKLYWKRGKVKLEIGYGKGKQQHDKRQSLKEKDWSRQKSRVIKNIKI